MLYMYYVGPAGLEAEALRDAVTCALERRIAGGAQSGRLYLRKALAQAHIECIQEEWALYEVKVSVHVLLDGEDGVLD